VRNDSIGFSAWRIKIGDTSTVDNINYNDTQKKDTFVNAYLNPSAGTSSGSLQANLC